MNNFSSYIPNKLIIADDKDHPWMNENIKKKIMAKKYEEELRCLLEMIL